MTKTNTVPAVPQENRGEDKHQENIFLRDWFSFTSKTHTPDELIAALGLSHVEWQKMEKGAHGYSERLYFNSISIHFGGRDDMGVWVEMTGTGCRAFEDHSTLPNKWDDLVKFVVSNRLHVTRFDIAFDDHTGVLDIDRVQQDLEHDRFVSPCTFWETVRSSEGKSAYVGSPQSPVRIRIYDKAAERASKDPEFDGSKHWVRVELQLRDKRADSFLRLTLPKDAEMEKKQDGCNLIGGCFKGTGEVARNLTLGQAFSGVLLNYLRMVEPSETDSNKSRWAMADYWADMMEEIGKITIFTEPGGSYSFGRCATYVFDLAGNAVDCMLDCMGVDEFVKRLKERRCKENPKYDMIRKDYQAWLEDVARDTAEHMFMREEWAYVVHEYQGKKMNDLGWTHI